MNLIDEVLRLDKEATKGPWVARREVVAIACADSDGVTRHPTACLVEPILRSAVLDREDISAHNFECYARTDGGPNSSLIALYRTAAPKLARALDKTKKTLAVLERLGIGGAIEDIAREIIAEIEKELAP